MTTPSDEALARAVNRLPSPGSGMSANDEDWVLQCYARGLQSIAETLVDDHVGRDRAEQLAGVILARWAQLEPPLTVALLQ